MGVVHRPSVRPGGEYVEARLLSSGPRTNPWFREAGDRRIESGDLVAFDTDLIGPAGYLADVSRTYLVDGTKPTARQQRCTPMPRPSSRRSSVS